MNETASENTSISSRRLTTVLAADICGYSQLAEVDEAAAIKSIELVHAIFDRAISRNLGRVFNLTGDGFYAEFPSVVDGLQAALDFSSALKASDTVSPSNPAARVRIGIHVGDVMQQSNGDILGHGVNIAARLQSEAEPNGILISLHAVNLVRNKIDAHFRRRGPLALKNIDEPVVAFDVYPGNKRPNLHSFIISHVRRIRLHIWPTIFIGMSLIFLNLLLFRFSTNPDQATIYSNSRQKTFAQNLEDESSKVNRQAVRMILQRVANSDEPLEDTVLSIYNHETLEIAAKALEQECRQKLQTLEERVARNRARINCNLQIGAILFEKNPISASAYYDGILDINPDHFDANKRLGRIYLMQGETEKAKSSFRRALKTANKVHKKHEEILWVKDHLAFALIHDRNFGDAIEQYHLLLQEADPLEMELLYSRLKTNLGIAYLLDNNYSAARPNFEYSKSIQEANKYYDELARTLSSLGRLEEMEERTSIQETQSEGDIFSSVINKPLSGSTRFETARAHYQRALDLETRLGRETGKLDGLLNLVRIDLANNNLKSADLNLEDALTISRKSGFKKGEAYSLAGKATIATLRGEFDKSCEYVKEIEKIASGKIELNEYVTKAIANTECPYVL